MRQAYSDWLLEQIWNDAASPWKLREVAARAGFSRLREVQEQVEWVASGSPWIDKRAQLSGDELAISLGLDNAIDAARRRGMDVFENLEKQSQVIAFAKEQGVPLASIGAGQRSAEEVQVAENKDADPGDKGEDDE